LFISHYLRIEKPAVYTALLLTERLYPLCREVDEAAAHRLAVIGNREIAHEVILSEIVYYHSYHSYHRPCPKWYEWHKWYHNPVSFTFFFCVGKRG